jgi:hypothetical protein
LPGLCNQLAIFDSPLWAVVAACLGLVLIGIHFTTRRSDSSTEAAFNLGLSSLGAVAGVQLAIISLTTLGCQKPAGPFQVNDLGFIAISAGIMTLVSCQGIAKVFRKSEQKQASEPVDSQ